MSTYTITNYDDNSSDTASWTYHVTNVPASGDTLKLGSDLGSSESPLTAISSIIVTTGVIFDGQGYKIYLDIDNFNGCVNLIGGTIQNLSIIPISTNYPSELNGFLMTDMSYGNVYNCSCTNGLLSQGCTGLLFGRIVGNTNIARCYVNGTCNTWLSGLLFGYLGNNGLVLTVDECYINGTVNDGSGGGLLAFFQEITINNCYFAGTMSSSGCAFMHIYNDGIAITKPMTITNSYSSSSSPNRLMFASGSPSASTINYCVADELINNSHTINSTTGNSTTMTDIQGQLYEPSGDSAGNWSTDYWTAGSGLDYPMLGQFALGPWTGYTAYNTSATLSAPYTGGGDRVAAESGGGGDPHMNPLIGKPYTLPKTEDTFLLIDNKVEHDRLIIKGKCWYLPKEYYSKSILRAYDHKNDSRANKLKDLFENGTFFKYIKIEYKGKEVIIDMDDLSLKNYDGKANLYSGSLPPSDKQGFKYGDMLTVGKIIGSKKGLYTATSTKTTHDTAYRTIMRTVEINTLDNNLTIELARDRKNIARRNSIKLSVNGNIGKFGGALIRKDVQIIDF